MSSYSKDIFATLHSIRASLTDKVKAFEKITRLKGSRMDTENLRLEEAICKAIADRLESLSHLTKEDLNKIKVEAVREFQAKAIPKNSKIIRFLAPGTRERLLPLLKLKPVRSISGVSVLTVMVKPYPCPHGRCTYCPGGPQTGTPSAYTGKEPASARALQCNYDPYEQVKTRIKQLREIGHEVDKVELIIFGGTLTSYPKDYLRWFITSCLNAISGAEALTLEDAQAVAENAQIRVSDIAMETRPDWCKEPHVDLMLELGATRVELGVQTVYDDIYELVNRGHTVNDVVNATRIAKDAGFSVVFHCMPNLPGSDYERDLDAFKKIFTDEQFMPDAIKIYPTLVLEGTKLYEMWRQGEYKPYPFEQIVELIAEVKKLAPPWVRIQRIQRDIPADLIAGGIRRGDLRALVHERLRLEGARCRCIRCREVGHVWYKQNVTPNPAEIKPLIRRYHASNGEELFLSFEDVKNDILIGLIRLREPSGKAHRREVCAARSMLVRELHVYGPLVKVGSKAKNGEWQHQGWGERLIGEAERISREEFDANKIIVLAGIGTRNYYRRFGYEKEGPYMVKRLG
jgi:elongator complex protein 3